MSRQLLVGPYAARTLSELDGAPYTSALASIGYEPRSFAVAQALGRCAGSAVEFEEGHVLAYAENLEGFRGLGWEAVTCPADFPRWVSEFIASHAVGESGEREAARPRIAIDISSMTRTRIAATVQALAELPAALQIGVDLLYAPATYRDPEPPPPALLRRAPVSPYYAGGLAMEDTTVVVVGLGYEQHKAAGTIEDFGPSRVLAFVPEGPDPQFLTAVLKANEGVLDGPLEPTHEPYAVADPYATFRRLEALCFDMMHRETPQTPVLVPLGPKVFAACCLLVGSMHREHVPVWRVSYRKDEPTVRAEASGVVFGLSVDVPLLSDTWSEL